MLYSVVLPAHRDDAFLAEAVASVEIAMADDDAELIIVANGPEGAAIAQRYAPSKTTPRRRMVQTGLPSLVHALNRGLEEARGDYIARMDSDDVCLPGRFKAQTERLAQGGVDFLFTRVTFVDAAKTELELCDEKWPNFPTLKFIPIHPTAMIRREALVALGGYGNVERAEDRHMWLAAIAKGYKFEQLQAPGILYRLHDGQITSEDNKPIGLATSVGLDLSHGLRGNDWLRVLHALTLGMARYLRCRLSLFMAHRFPRKPAGGLAVDPVENHA